MNILGEGSSIAPPHETAHLSATQYTPPPSAFRMPLPQPSSLLLRRTRQTSHDSQMQNPQSDPKKHVCREQTALFGAHDQGGSWDSAHFPQPESCSVNQMKTMMDSYHIEQVTTMSAGQSNWNRVGTLGPRQTRVNPLTIRAGQLPARGQFTVETTTPAPGLNKAQINTDSGLVSVDENCGLLLGFLQHIENICKPPMIGGFSLPLV